MEITSKQQTVSSIISDAKTAVETGKFHSDIGCSVLYQQFSESIVLRVSFN